MAADLPTTIDELIAAREFENLRIDGYYEILSFPPEFLSDEGRSEVNQALSWSNSRFKLLTGSIEALQALVDNNYPTREPQFASVGVVNELRLRLLMISNAVAEFQEFPEGHLIVSEEMPV
jgi:hypothetical protein